MPATLASPAPAMKPPDEGERVPRGSPLAAYVWVNPERMHGEPCFEGSRVPIKTLFDHLRAGDPLEEFLDGFPPVTREQAVAVIDFAALGLLANLRSL